MIKRVILLFIILSSCESEAVRNSNSKLSELEGTWKLETIIDKYPKTIKNVPYPTVLDIAFDACKSKKSSCMAHFSTKAGQSIDVAYTFVYNTDMVMINFTKNADLEADPVLSQIVTSWQIGTVEKSRVQIFSPVFPIYELVLIR